MTDASGVLSIDTSTSTTPSYAKFTMPYVSIYPKYMTLVARVTGNSGSYKASDLEIALSPNASTVGLRVKTIISTATSTGVQVEKYDGTTSVADKSDTSGSHIYQVAVTLTSATTGSFAVYVDGSATPTLTQSNVTLRAAGAAGDNYIGFGANSSSNIYQSKIDWIVWTPYGAFTPAQALGTLPSGLGTTTGY